MCSVCMLAKLVDHPQSEILYEVGDTMQNLCLSNLDYQFYAEFEINESQNLNMAN